MIDESTSRSTDKSCIVYVRYVENFEAKTSYYGLLDLNSDGTAKNIFKSLTCLWKKDDLNPKNSCWLATDNASTFTGEFHSFAVCFLGITWRRWRFQVSMKVLLPNFVITWIPTVWNRARAWHTRLHRLVLMHHSVPSEKVGFRICIKIWMWTAQFSFASGDQPAVRFESIAKVESTIGQIYKYFNKSWARQSKLKNWQSFLEVPELKIKRIFTMRWSSVRNCIKPIVLNIQPGLHLRNTKFRASLKISSFRISSIIGLFAGSDGGLPSGDRWTWICAKSSQFDLGRWISIPVAHALRSTSISNR